MAPPTFAGFKTAVYHCPINASSDPTPEKPPSQRAQYITQVPESPSASQRARPAAASQTRSDDLVQDSLEQHPSAPPCQPSTFLDFLEQTEPIENSQPADNSCQQDIIISRSQSQGQVIAQSSIEGSSPKHLPSQSHSIEEDSVQVPPLAHLPSLNNTAVIADETQLRIPFQRSGTTEHLTQAHASVQTEPDHEDEDEEEVQDCITVRSRPATPPAAEVNTRKTTNSSAGLSPVSRGSEDFYNATPLNRTGLLHPDVSATTGITTPSMPPKTSTTKGTTSTSQNRKAASTASKKSSKPAQPLPDIVNEGETSAAAVLQKMRAGGNSQANTTRQASKAMPEAVPRAETSQKSSARPRQAPAKKSAPKPAQQRQSQPPVPSTKEPSRRDELPDGRGEFDFSPDPVTSTRPAVPWHPEEGKVKSTKITKSTAASALSKKISKSQPKKKATKAPESDEDDDDEEYSAPKTSKSRTTITTRASTRAQTRTTMKNDGPNVSTRNTKASNATQKELPVSRKSAPSHREEEIEDFEDSVTHINSGGAASPQPTALSTPAKPLAAKQTRTRRITEKEAKLMHDAVSSPDRTITSAAIKPQRSNKKAPVPQASPSPVHETIPEQGTTKRNPVNIDDDGSNDDDENAMNEDLGSSYDDIITGVMGQKPQEKQKASPAKDKATCLRLRTAHEHVSDTHSDLDLMGQERAQRKPNIVGFDADGPRNQGLRQQKKPSSLETHNLPFEEASFPDLDSFSMKQRLVTSGETSGPDMQSKEALNLDVSEIPAHVATIDSLRPTTSGDVAPSISSPTSGQPRKAVASMEIPSTKGTRSTRLESLAEPVAINHKETKVQPVEKGSINDKHLNEMQKTFKSQTQSEFHVEPARQPLKKPEDLDEKLYEKAYTTESSAPLTKQALLMSEIATNQATVGSIHSVARKHAQASSDHCDTQARPHVVQPQDIDKPSKTTGSREFTPPVEHDQESTTMHQFKVPAMDRKRPAVEVAGEATKRLKAGTHGHHAQLTQLAAAKNPGFRKLSQVDDNGSPMPYREEISQEKTTLVTQTRQKSATTASTLTRYAMHQPTDESFARPAALVRNETARSESPLQEVGVLEENTPLQVSQPITHAGFDGDTQVTTEDPQTFDLFRDFQKHASPVPCDSPPRKAPPVKKSTGLMEALRSEVVQRTDAPGAEENDDQESLESEKSMEEEEDPDKTLVNADSDDGDDSDDDGSESRSSSDTDGDDVAKSALSLWRDALESHQGDVYDQLVRIAHRLTNHLKDHETAIKDINTDYSQDGTKLVQRLVEDNEAKLEEYCLIQSKMRKALNYGCEQVHSSLHKDMKDVMASRERFVKTLQKQVNEVGRLDQIMQTYQA